MKKSFSIFTIILIIIIIITLCSCRSTDNDDAQKDKNSRYLTIINETGQIINEVHVTVGEGTEIEAMGLKNPDTMSFSLKVPKEYEEYTTFVVTLVDRYDLKYQTKISGVPQKGRTEVVITEEDYVKEKGDLWNKLDQWFNGD